VALIPLGCAGVGQVQVGLRVGPRAPVGDGEVSFQPQVVCAVVDIGRHGLDFHRHTRLGQLLLPDGRDGRNRRELLRGESDGQPVAIACFREELLGLLHVAGRLRHVEVELRIAGADGGVAAGHAQPFERGIQDSFAVSRGLERLPHSHVAGRLLVGAHAQDERGIGWLLIDLDVRIRFEGLDELGRQVDQVVHLTAAQRLDLGRGIAHEDELHAIEVGQLVAVRVLHPVVRVSLEGQAVLGEVLVDHEWASAVELGLEILGRAVDDDCMVIAQVEQEVGIGLLEREDDRRIVGGLYTGDVPVKLNRGRAHFGVAQAVERELHVVGGQRLAVVELHALAHLERPGQSVGAGFPALRQAAGLVRAIVFADEDEEVGPLAGDLVIGNSGEEGRVQVGRRKKRMAQGAAIFGRSGSGFFSCGLRSRRFCGRLCRGCRRGTCAQKHAGQQDQG